MSTNIDTAATATIRPGAREVLLAGIGAVSLIRKNATGAVKEAVAIAGRAPKAAGIAIEGIGEQGRFYRERMTARASVLGQRAVTAAGEWSTHMQSRLQPVLGTLDGLTARFGLRLVKTTAKRTGAKRARKTVRVAAKRKARKAA
ncbi:MAG: hypothetical protein JSS44_07510 [Proteobacteria bacterium]|nr:hypothetical protein [Pseudomonadota bacterium]